MLSVFTVHMSSLYSPIDNLYVVIQVKPEVDEPHWALRQSLSGHYETGANKQEMLCVVLECGVQSRVQKLSFMTPVLSGLPY